MGISFNNQWALVLIPIAIAGLFLLRHKDYRGHLMPQSRIALVLRFLLLIFIVLALSSPTCLSKGDAKAVVFIADLSASNKDQSANMLSFIHAAEEAKNGKDMVGIVTVGRNALVNQPLSSSKISKQFQYTDPEYTNLADGLRLASSLFAPDTSGSIVLLSDGQQNLGDVIEEAHLLRIQGIPVDIVPLKAASNSEVILESINMPSNARSGEDVPINIRITSTLIGPANLQLSLNGKVITNKQFNLKQGTQELTFEIPVQEPGLLTLGVELDAKGDTWLQNNKAYTFVNVEGPPQVLVIEEKPGAGENISKALISTGIQTDSLLPSQFPADFQELARYSSIVLVNIHIESLSDQSIRLIKGAVRDEGKGLVVIGGEGSLTLGGYRNTALEKVLPVKSEVPQEEDRGKIALVLALDKSGSMNQNGFGNAVRLVMAKSAAQGAIAELKPYDEVGILAFDASTQWIVPMQEVRGPEERKEINQKIGALRADGGTEIYTALLAAYQAFADTQAPKKHIILLTDGNSYPGKEYPPLLADMKEDGITLSTIGLGSSADLELLKFLATEGQGRFYSTERSENVPQIVIGETQMTIHDPIVEEVVQIKLVSSSPVLDVVEGEFPALDGYVVTVPKDTAQVVLESDQGDPLLVQWQYGLGRSVVWTSDIQGRWSKNLLQSEWSGLFWSALVNWSLPPEQLPFQLSASFSQGEGNLIVEGNSPEGSQLTVRIVTPEMEAMQLPFKATSPTRYETAFPAIEQGVYQVRVTETTASGQQRGLYSALVVPYSPEYSNLESDINLLNQVAQITGGEILQEPSTVFNRSLPSGQQKRTPLTGWLLVVAVLLLPIDIAVRKLKAN